MKSRSLTIAILAVLVTVFATFSAQAMTVLGNHPFYKPQLASVEEFQQMVQAQQADIQKGLELAGSGSIFDSFMAQIGSAEIKPVEYYKGQKFQWMFYRRNGQGPVRVDKTVLWEGDEPFAAYEFFIDHDGDRYTFGVPLICSNLALKDISPIPAPPPPPPVAKIESQPEPKPEPKPEPQPEPEPELAALPFSWLLDAGYLYQADPAHYLFVRGGIEYPFNENWSVIGLLGVAPKIDGIDGKTAFLADVLFNYSYQKFFAAGGIGAWITGGDSDLDTEDNDVDLILELGYQVYEKPDKFTVDGFIEARSAFDEMSDFDLYGRLGAGLRFRF
jgi:hypothetical protein